MHLSCKAKHCFYEVSHLPRQELRRHDINILVPTLPQEKLAPMAKIGRGFQLLVYRVISDKI